MHLERTSDHLDDDIHSVCFRHYAFAQRWMLLHHSSGWDLTLSDSRHWPFALTRPLKRQFLRCHRRCEVEEDVHEAAETAPVGGPKMKVGADAAKQAPHLRFVRHQTPQSRRPARHHIDPA